MDLSDAAGDFPILSSTREFAGRVWDVVRDRIDLGEGGQVTRDYVAHTGAVAVIAYRDDQVYLVRQYRHPVRRHMWEPPAGLCDVVGEPLLEAAKRELAEEADLRADTWHVLVDFHTTPGGSSEGIRIFLAQDLHEVPVNERFEREAEERLMTGQWWPREAVLTAITTGQVTSPTLLMGVFALEHARTSGFTSLRSA